MPFDYLLSEALVSELASAGFYADIDVVWSCVWFRREQAGTARSALLGNGTLNDRDVPGTPNLRSVWWEWPGGATFQVLQVRPVQACYVCALNWLASLQLCLRHCSALY